MLRFPLCHDSNGNGKALIIVRSRRRRISTLSLLTAGFLMIINILWSDPDPSSSSRSSSSSLFRESHRLLTDDNDNDNDNDNNEQAPTTENNETVSIENFFMHIPKAGGVFAFRFLEDLARSVRSSRRPCYMGTSPLETLLLPARGDDTDTSTTSSSSSTSISTLSPSDNCLIYMSEQKYSHLPKQTYAIVRNLRDHVLSQFFHCKESDAHGDRARFMPDSLDEWLEAWIATLDHDSNFDDDNNFHCYDPRNMQTSFVFHSGTNDTAADTAPATPPIDSQEIERKFHIIAPAERMTTSLCVIFIHISGRVPNECVCDDDEGKDEEVGDETDEVARSRKQKRKRQLNGPISDPDHGVVHHAHSFETTDRQEELIGRLVERDNELYDRVWELFEKRLGETETEFGVKLC